MDELDFGPINSVVPDECCEEELDFGDIVTNDEVLSASPVRRNFILIAHKDFNQETCTERKFTVNLHKDGSWSFTFTDGTFLTQEQIDTYCNQIKAAQSKLETEQNWQELGRGLGKWDFYNNPGGANGTGANSNSSATYYPAGRSDDTFGLNGSCAVQGPNAF